MTRARAKVTALDDLFGGTSVEPQDGLLQIPIAELYEFPGHPYKVTENADMESLVQSIKENGVLLPLILWKRDKGGYYIVSGHRRRYASEKAGLSSIPAVVREYTEEEAVLAMVDSNLYREEILPSEKAWAYRMKLEAMNRQGCRDTASTSRPVGERSLSADAVGEEQGDSGRQVQRFVRLTYLLPDLLEMVDAKKLKFRPAVELSYLTEEQQAVLKAVMGEENRLPSLEQATRLKALAVENRLNRDVCYTVLTEEQAKKAARFQLRQEVLRKYVPEEYTEDETVRLIESLLKEWHFSTNGRKV